MNRILSVRPLSENVYRMELEAPLVARSRKPGQFVIVMVDADCGERIPLTIADADAARGTITLIFQTVGATTLKLARLAAGESLGAVLGPLGRPTDLGTAPRRIVCVGGGIGVAPLYPIAQALKAAGNDLTVIMGARTKDLFVMEDEMRALVGEKLVLVTDDGSYGRKGLVTEPLAALLEAARREGSPVDEVIAIGPPVMMKFCALAAKPFGVKTTVSLNTIMIDGTGMCGGCRVTVGGKVRFVCVDGPEFDGQLVDWDQMLRRLSQFKSEEAVAREHVCQAGLFGRGAVSAGVGE